MSQKISGRQEVVEITHDAAPELRVVIVDRDSMSSDLLAHALARSSKYDAVAVQSDLLLRTLANSEVDLLVIGAEIDSRSCSGFDLAFQVHSTYLHLGIVVLLNEATDELVLGAFRAGARGVFCRQQPMAELLDCIEHVGKGFIWAGRDETSLLLNAIRNLPSLNLVTAPDSPTLTARELQVVQHAAKGKTNKNIASDLGLSEHTVKNYLFRAFEKLGVSSRVEMLFYLTQRGHTFSSVKPDVAADDLDIK